jgi:hypothetical protein
MFGGIFFPAEHYIEVPEVCRRHRLTLNPTSPICIGTRTQCQIYSTLVATHQTEHRRLVEIYRRINPKIRVSFQYRPRDRKMAACSIKVTNSPFESPEQEVHTGRNLWVTCSNGITACGCREWDVFPRVVARYPL